MLELSQLKVCYDQAVAVDHLSFSVGKGQVIGLIGRNGTGKSSTLKTMIGLHPAAHGQMLWQGQDFLELPTHQRVQRGLGYVPEERRIFAKLSLEDNLLVAIKNPADIQVQLAYVYDLFPELWDKRLTMGGLLSGGQQQMLCIARTLMGKPDILLLDEPSEGLAPMLVRRIGDSLEQLKQTGISMVIAEQSLPFSLRLCDQFVLLSSTHRAQILSAEQVANDPSPLHRILSL